MAKRSLRYEIVFKPNKLGDDTRELLATVDDLGEAKLIRELLNKTRITMSVLIWDAWLEKWVKLYQ